MSKWSSCRGHLILLTSMILSMCATRILRPYRLRNVEQTKVDELADVPTEKWVGSTQRSINDRLSLDPYALLQPFRQEVCIFFINCGAQDYRFYRGTNYLTKIEFKVFRNMHLLLENVLKVIECIQPKFSVNRSQRLPKYR